MHITDKTATKSLRNSQIEAFHSIARLGTVHAASRELRLTQTAVTLRLQSLERALGLTLFLRSRRGMSLTDDGKALLAYSLGCLELEGLFRSRVGGPERTEVQLTVVGPTSAISTRIAENVETLYQRHPFLRLHLRSEDHADLIEMIRRGEADLAVVSPEHVPNEMDSKMLKADRYVLVASSKWKGRRLTEILETERILDFYESDPMTKKYLQKFSLLTHVKPNRLFVNENEALIRLMAAGVGYCTLTETVARPHLESGAMTLLNRGLALEEPLALAWYARPNKSDYFQDLVRSIR